DGQVPREQHQGVHGAAGPHAGTRPLDLRREQRRRSGPVGAVHELPGTRAQQRDGCLPRAEQEDVRADAAADREPDPQPVPRFSVPRPDPGRRHVRQEVIPAATAGESGDSMTRTPQRDVPRVGFVSLGCPKATVDSENILTRLRAEGYDISGSYEDADLVVVNTCGFIDAAVEESLDAIGEALAENGKVIVTGCLGAKEGVV